VQSGVARTGKWWGHEHFDGGEPDVLLFAKGIGSGYPFAGMATKDHMWDGLPPGTMGEESHLYIYLLLHDWRPFGLATWCFGVIR
jgi:4-aminobutyrate aminotransferase-like enzyme